MAKQKEVIDLGEFIIENAEDEAIFKKYLIERINGNEMYKPAGLKQKFKKKVINEINSLKKSDQVENFDNRNNIKFI